MGKFTILYVHPWPDLYGSSTYLYQLLKRVDKNLFTPIVILPTEGPLLEKLKKEGIETYILPVDVLQKTNDRLSVLRLLINFALGLIKLLHLIKKRNVQIIHTNTCHILAGAVAGRITKLTNIWHVHERDISPAILRKVLARIIIFLADKIITVSKGNTVLFFDKLSFDKKIKIIMGGVDLEKFNTNVSGEKIRAEFGISSQTKLVGTVGRITPWKGHKYFIEAAAIMTGNFKDVKFIIAGDADTPMNFKYKNELIDMTEKLGLTDKVIFTGFREDIDEIMAAMDIFVLPSSESEPCGLVLFEAMALCKPVVATAGSGPLEILSPDINGILVPMKDSAEMAKAINILLQDEKKRNMMGMAGRACVEDFHTWERTVDKIEQTYFDIILSRKGKQLA